MFCADGWREYELIDASQGERLERWGRRVLIRPDPQVIWRNPAPSPLWDQADGVYRRSPSGGGAWEGRNLPAQWTISYRDGLRFLLRPMGFKHTGLFPEQAANWDWFSALIRRAAARRPVTVLNLFAYTGGATMAAAKAGASVVHVDAAKGMVAHARENAALCGLADAPIRYLVDDCRAFAEREIRRGRRYDGIIMDPPSYGRGPGGEVWKLEDGVDALVGTVSRLLRDDALFFLLNSYTTGLSPLCMKYLVDQHVGRRLGGRTSAGELALPVTQTGSLLPCGAAARWEGTPAPAEAGKTAAAAERSRHG